MTEEVTKGSASDPSGSVANYSVQNVAGFDYDDDDFLTTKVYHGVSITAGADSTTVVGRIQSWQPDSYTRDGLHLYELASTSWGRPVEFIPGKATGFTIAVTRAEVWNAEMERAFNDDSSQELYNDLIDQTRPFKIREFWIRGEEKYTIWTYHGCWFTNKNMEAVTSDGDGITRISATLAYVSKTHS